MFEDSSEPKVIVSMSLGHSVLFKLRRRAPENTPSQIWLDHGDLLVMDGLTQYEYDHSAASELLGPLVDLEFHGISQHVRFCPQAGSIGCALPSGAQDLAEPHSCGVGRSWIHTKLSLCQCIYRTDHADPVDVATAGVFINSSRTLQGHEKLRVS